MQIVLIPEAQQVVERLSVEQGLSLTDVVNRALQVYGFVQDQRIAGGQLAVQHADGSVQLVDIEEG